MITRVGAAPRLASMSLEEFQAHWRTSHADAASRIPGVRRYVQNHAVLEAGRLILPYPGFDAISELDFDSVEAMEAGFASETYRAVVAADERAFVDKDRFSLVVGEPRELQEGAEAGVKLVELHQLHPGATTTALTAAVATDAVAAIAAGATRYVVITPSALAHRPGTTPAAADAVTLSWWPGVGQPLDYLRSGARWHLAGVVAASASALTKPVRVV